MPVQISTKTIHILTGFGATFLIALAILGPTDIIDYSGVAGVVALILILAFSLRFAPKITQPHIIILAWFIIIFFLPRLLSFLIFPQELVPFNSVSPLIAAEINKTMIFIALGTGAMILGFFLASAFKSSSSNLAEHGNESSIPLGPIILYFGLSLLAAYYIMGMQNVSVFSTPENWGSRSGWLVRIFDTDVALLAFIVWLLGKKDLSLKEKLIVTFCITVWLGFTLLIGSRGGVLRIFFLVSLAALAIWSDPKLKGGKLPGILALVIVGSIALYPISTAIRYTIGGVENASEQVSSDWGKFENLAPLSNMSKAQEALWSNDIYRKAVYLATPLIVRLGIIDFPAVIISRDAREDVVDRFLSIEYATKNYLNNMVPGELFPENDIMTSRVFTMVHRGVSEEHIRTYFLSEPWTSWGFAWIKGGAVGGLAIMFLFGFISQFIYQILNRFFSSTYRPYILTSWLFMGYLNGPLQLFGLDHLFTVASHFYMALSILLLTVVGSQVILGRLGVKNRSWVKPSAP